MDNPTINKHITFKIQSLLLLVPLFSCLVFGFGQSTVYSYHAQDNIAVNCGFQTQALSQSQRLWLADTSDSKVFTFLDHSNANSTVSNSSKTSEAHKPPQSRGDRVPYITATLSLSPFTYSFSVSRGQKFIRLYFYSAYYPGFKNYSPFFCVTTCMDGHFILLNNFTALASAVDDSDTMIKEFCINIGEGERLNITFTPSSTISNTYAFINGIEIVSMPTDLYYNNPTYKFKTYLVGIQGALYAVENDTALELMYRVNVGGNGISPREDTGMYREWEVDYGYLHVDIPIAMPVDSNDKIDLKFSMVMNYTAPESVHRTAVSMGNDARSNERHNLTYTLPVHTGFTYLVRLHFCELMSIKASERVFAIYVATFLAERSADVVNWSGESRNGIALYRDYAVMIGKIEGAKETMKQNLTIQLHPAEIWRTVIPDVILNGIEIFKISNGGDLSGTHLYLPTTKPPSVSTTNTPPSADNQSKYAIIGGVLAGVTGLSFLAFFIIRQRQKLNKGKDAAASSDRWTSWFPLTSFTTTNKSTKSQNSTLPSALCRYFLLSEIKAATNNFDEVFIIGRGGFGDVYKGFISSLLTEVAIKRLKQGSKQGAAEFKTEIEMLSQLRHLQLVSLIGYCNCWSLAA